jgi:hypothetical protein
MNAAIADWLMAQANIITGMFRNLKAMIATIRAHLDRTTNPP